MTAADPVLVDTSVWVDHFRRGNTRLIALLEEEQVLLHPLILGELACGNPKDRREILGMLADLPALESVNHAEVLEFIEREALFGSGLGWIDIHLLAACARARCRFWTLDRKLRMAAGRLDVAF